MSKRKDIQVVVQLGDVIPTRYELLRLEAVRQLADAELVKRGNPAYDPSEYLDPLNWRL